MKRKKIGIWMTACMLTLAVTGCGKGTEESTAAATTAPVMETTAAPAATETLTAATSVAETSAAVPLANLAAAIKELEMKNAAPSEFMDLAKNQIAEAAPEEVTAFAKALLNAQKSYIEEMMPFYEEANANPEFMDLYALDITQDLADKIKDQTIRTQVQDTYDNGLILKKAEGYVYPIVDVAFYKEQVISHMPEAEGAALETEINTFNSGL
ncbi:MAG: hypothetical protein RR590_02150 [Hungatella sp.]